ncbi:MAG: hypothetical protein ACLSAH_03425 [Bilophila wadsworthia]
MRAGFWVHNRVQGWNGSSSSSRNWPECAYRHGARAAAGKAEETMHAFWHGELDILVCTAIVESGLDFLGPIR